uniref:Uncharacterized protein n=1 Tax=Panagrolaimus sp. ES5 TaxID=591445 RepID=A0AC34G8W8_9BILA
NGITLPYIPTTPPTTTTPSSSCIPPPNAAALFIETGVVLSDGTASRQADPIGTCKNSQDGMTAYYNGVTSNQYPDGGAVWVGEWKRTGCLLPCVCTASTCYVPMPGNPSPNPIIFLYPHCSAPDQCFIALVFGSDGTIANPMNPLEMFDGDDQTGDDVNDPSFPKIESIGCSGCPVMP